MHFSIPLLIASLIYLLLVLILFFSKPKIKTIENKIYSILLITTCFGIFLDILGIFAHMNLPETSILRWMIVKFYMLYLLTFVILITIYIICICRNIENKNKTKIELINNKKSIIFIIIYITFTIINFLLPFSYYKDNNIVYIFGPNSIFLYSFTAINILVWIFYPIKKIKTIEKRKILPIMTFIIFCIPIIIIQLNHPELLLVTSLSAFVVVFMYHTIENPDIKMIEQLNIARDQADKANNAKSEFLSNMSHEIRTPLNAIVGFSQDLEEEELPEEAREEVKDIIMASQNLLEIVNGILDISKIEANKLEIVNSEYDFNKILDELVALTKARMGDKPLDFRTNFESDIPKVLYGDHTRVKQIILNLLTNAVKYTKEGYISFNVSSVIKDNICRLIISVEDSGIGIKKENISKLFSKFERFELEKNITIEGTGLGLAITKQLIDLMHGKIVVQSEYGKGSKFTVSIDQKIVKTPTIEIKEDKKISEIATFDVSGKKVLVVDDNKLNLKVAQRLLRDYNLEIETLDNGFDCIEKIKKGNTYDLVLMDDMMPKMTGSETLQKLKEITEYNIPTIALTANAITGMKEKYLKAGFDDYLSKPIDKLELNRIINQFLNKNK